ncbi:hypothetical protein BC827DRAFT_1267685 [Russula dissimulans]|nr:hypothetical protein BC827DRAFT_1267685 [Russula dissimulans]
MLTPIAKKVREKSNEIEILNLLNTIQPKSKHVIPWLDSFHTQSMSRVILPKLTSVPFFLKFAPGALYDEVSQVCRGLINGLAYLHEHCIAHGDIKPDNLLVDDNEDDSPRAIARKLTKYDPNEQPSLFECRKWSADEL